MFISPLVKLSTVPNTYISLGQGKSCGFVQFVRKADVERGIGALGGYSIGGSKAGLSLGRSAYLYYSRYHCLPDRDFPFLDRALVAPTPPLWNPTVASNPKSGPSGNRDPSSIPTPAPEGRLTNDQVNHIIQRLQVVSALTEGHLVDCAHLATTHCLRDTLFQRYQMCITRY